MNKVYESLGHFPYFATSYNSPIVQKSLSLSSKKKKKKTQGICIIKKKI